MFNFAAKILKYVKINSGQMNMTASIHPKRRTTKWSSENWKNCLSDVHYNEKAGTSQLFLPTLTGTCRLWAWPTGDTADFNSENVKPQITENYDGESKIQLGDSEFTWTRPSSRT